MFYMGEEIGDGSFIPDVPAPNKLDWSAGDATLRAVYRNLIGLRLGHPSLATGRIEFFCPSWSTDQSPCQENKTINYWRFVGQNAAVADLVVALNFDHQDHEMTIKFPASGTWYRYDAETGANIETTVENGELTPRAVRVDGGDLPQDGVDAVTSPDRNPWLSLPAADYEGHMANPAVQQLGYLNEVFRETLAETRPTALAVPGCTTGNGFEHIPAETSRIVGIDIHPEYLDTLRRRFAPRLPGLDLVCADVRDPSLVFDSLDLVHCALLLEYVEPGEVVSKLASWLRRGGMFSVVLQLPFGEHAPVTETPYTSVRVLGPCLRLVPPERLDELAAAAGLSAVHRRIDTLPTGKQFFVALYRAD
jgi:hypothetical protein